MIKLYTDAATKGNPGPSAGGVLLVVDGIQHQIKVDLPFVSNHEAEFLAAIAGFEYVKEHYGCKHNLFFYSDSKIVITSLEKNYSKSYPELLAKLNKLHDQFTLVVYQWIPEKQNQGAHQLALQGLAKFIN
ncbi:ribonuclease HI family protein [Ligilactobacillus sp. Marseille-Q7487]|jgi:ribonuclease HI|uniref:ribonuclease HI family protein n=1 Tax=Ligilactobacillus sp. Marseille-Q7487 TaxID=3022128 RepID=UPI0015B61048|nr:ribonuclease HI family protein [Ligilactobacillus sp. Marseille-Q7487]